jgi:zinc protease
MMRRGLFGDRAYGLHTNGTEASVQRLSLADIKRLHQTLAVPNNCVLAIFGDVKTEEVREELQKRFGAWQRGADALKTLAPVPAISQVKRAVETRDKKQAVMMIGFAGTSVHDADRYPLELIQEACSDLGSRLFMRVREKLGLAYYVGAHNFPGLIPGYFAFYVGTEPGKVDLVESEMLKEAELLRTEGLSEEELKRAKAKVIGQKKIARQDLGQLAMTVALDELYGLGYTHTDTEDAKFEAVTIEQIKLAAKKYLKADALVIALVKPDK